MKTTKILCIVLVACTLMSCQTRRNNIELTDFTRELISLYVNHPDNHSFAKNRNKKITIVSFTDTSHYCLSIFFDSNDNVFYTEDFVGQTSYLGFLVRVFGDYNSVFYSVKDKVKTQRRCERILINDSPNVWRICFHRDTSFCRMRTRKEIGNEDISAIEDLVKRHFRAFDTLHPMHENEIFSWDMVDTPAEFLFGDDSLTHFIISNFELKRRAIYPQHGIATIIDILVDKDGKATVTGIRKSSNDVEFDNEALRVAEAVSQHEFIPATHRGHRVNNSLSISFFWQWALLPN